MKTAALHPLARQIAQICNDLHQAGLSPSHSGNVSARDDEVLWITSSGFSMKDVAPDNLVMIWPSGKISAEPGLKPSSELPMHQAIYKARPDVNAIVHTHPAKATALAVARQPLDKNIISEILFTLGEVPLVPYYLPGSQALADAVAEGLKAHDAVLMSNHGVIAVGKTIEDAYYNMELVESFAEVTILARQMNGLNELSPAQVSEILAAKQKMGL